jgi:hypothetical protein
LTASAHREHNPGVTPTVETETAVEQHDVERIARATLKELGVVGAEMKVAPEEGRPGQWRIELKGSPGPNRLKITCGRGSSAQWVRAQIYEQFTS